MGLNVIRGDLSYTLKKKNPNGKDRYTLKQDAKGDFGVSITIQIIIGNNLNIVDPILWQVDRCNALSRTCAVSSMKMCFSL